MHKFLIPLNLKAITNIIGIVIRAVRNPPDETIQSNIIKDATVDISKNTFSLLSFSNNKYMKLIQNTTADIALPKLGL